MATRKTVKGTGKAKWADAAGGETTIKPGKAGVLGRMLPDFPIPQLKTSPDETPIPKPAPRVFFADDDRMKWAIYCVSGGAERAAGRINSWIIGGHLPIDFELDDLLALARRGAPGVSQAFFTPRAISEASRDINALDGDGKVQQANTQTTGRPGKKPGPSPNAQRLRDKLYDARQVHILKAGASTAESWAKFIPKFIKGLRPKSLLSADVYLQYRGTCKARELDAKGWAALYKQEYFRRHKKTRG